MIPEASTRPLVLVIGDAEGPLRTVIQWLLGRQYPLTVLPATRSSLRSLGDLEELQYPDVVVAEVLAGATIDSQDIVAAITGRPWNKQVQVLLLTSEELDLEKIREVIPMGSRSRHVASLFQEDLSQAVEILLEKKRFLDREDGQGLHWIH